MKSFNTIYFVGLSKNCFHTLESNLSFIRNLQQYTEKTITTVVVDSDSNDGTKEYCRSLELDWNNFKFIEEDGLGTYLKTRIEKISHCRNIGIQNIKKDKDLIYIPLDMDINLFEHTSPEEFAGLINYFINLDNTDGLFPFSFPFYYDIFALRKIGWVNGNNVLLAHNLKSRFKIGSFIFNYYYVFRKQIKNNGFKNQLIKVDSAFGGIGFYKLIKNKNYLYKVHEQNPNFYSEHIFFNKKFNNLYIKKDWLVPAPKEHINFKESNYPRKIIYIAKTIKYDFLTILKRM